MKKMKTVLMIICLGFLSFLLLPNVHAITDNEVLEYTSHKDQTGGPIKFVVENYMGTCLDYGNPASESGTAKMTKIANDSDIAKAAYFFGVKLGYAEGLGTTEGSHYYYESRSFEYLIQDIAGTLDDDATSGHERADALKASHPEWNSTQVPASFEIFKGDPLNESQRFVVWRTKPFSAKKEYNSGTPSGLDHALVKNGDIIKYDITWENGTGTMTITDHLSKGLKYVKGSANIGDPTITTNNETGETVLTWKTTEASGTLTYSAKVEVTDPCGMAIDEVQNNATMTVDNKPYKLAELENPLSKKCYAPMPNDGYNHNKVKVGDDIKYKITLNNVKDVPVVAVVTDIFSKGLTYNKDATVSAGTLTNVSDPSVDGNKNTKVQFTINIPAKTKVELVYSAKVNNDAVVKVLNNASVQYDNGRTIALNKLENPIYVPKKDIPTPDTGSNVAILGIASGIALVGVGGYFIYRKYKKA